MSERASAGAIVAAILLPPLGVWLADGICPAFWLSVVLTCIAIVPGILFSLVAVLRPDVLGGLTGRAA